MSKVLVNVHGAGKQMSDFYKEALAELTLILGSEPACLPCWYADLSNVGSAVRAYRRPSPRENKVREALLEEICQRQRELQRAPLSKRSPRRTTVRAGSMSARTVRPSTRRATRSLMDMPAMVTDVIADVVRYLFDSRLQKAIKQRLNAVLVKAAEGYDETILVSHSLGTVASFDVLRDAADRYNITRFVTMGSPLRKLATVGCHSMNLGAISRDTVPFWRNLYDTTDLVADAIGPAFPGYPIEDVFIQVADAPIPSHDYWRNRQVLEMIAGWL